LDCGVPLVQIPCQGVTTHLLTTLSELNAFVRGKNAIGDYLCAIYEAYMPDHYARSKVIWDIAAIAYLIHPDWVPTDLVHSPILTDQITWSQDHRRHFIRSASAVRRDSIFHDLFEKLRASG
jgi:inosine-uridine nucleoside N-ribohydrolase